MTPPPEESPLLTILSNYSNDLANLKKRNGKLPAQAAINAIEKLIQERERLARIDEIEKLMGQSYHTEKSETVVRMKMRLERLKGKS